MIEKSFEDSDFMTTSANPARTRESVSILRNLFTVNYTDHQAIVLGAI